MKWEKDLKPFSKFLHASAGFGNPSATKPSPDTIAQVQRSYAKMKYIVDGDKDHWSTPEEFKANGGGDCEDFAMTKYKDLLSYGFPDEAIHMVVGHKKNTGELHAVLTVNDGEKTWVLDNQHPNDVLPIEHLNKMDVAYQINRTGWGRGNDNTGN